MIAAIVLHCAISGQFYKESNSCPKTCSEPYRVCPLDTSGCSCPNGQLIDEEKLTCVEPEDCPKIDPCTIQPYKGPCNGQIQRYFYNSTSQKCEVFYYGGCHSNGNNFFTKHDCEEKCSACPPTCSREYCVTKRGAVCTIDDKSIGSNVKCPRGCLISNCWACYYSYTALPYPVQAFSCPVNCPLDAEGQLESKCMQNWGHCVLIAYTNIYKE
uniref:BPTI/Kunitz inhibitor domain-containing protein n=1 Tax=Amphimedon queenslandica TaxID=400682 RepID=A0A1X7SF68_AMPQE